jgi:drug/metabolite transporter (DMT)-like permease
MKVLLIILSTILSIGYTLYYIFMKSALKTISNNDILVNVYVFSALIVLILFHKSFIKSINNYNKNYIYVFLLACTMVATNFFTIIACRNNINFGRIESLSSVIYLPIVSLVSYYLYNGSLTKKNFFGIILVSIGSYFII